MWSTKSVIGADGQFDRSALDVVSVRSGAPVERLRELLQQLDQLKRPCGAQIATRALVSVRALTATRPGSDISVEMQAVAYVSQLAPYPADAVEAACAEWPDRSTWWPSWHELREAVERRTTPRDLLRRALLQGVEQASP